MGKKAVISCSCRIEFDGCGEYEALDEIYEMFEEEYPLTKKTTLRLTEIITTSADGCAISYKENRNGNVRRNNSSEVVPKKLTR